MNRRAAHCKNRRLHHAKMRQTTVIRQENQSSKEGPDDSRTAQTAQKALKSRRALLLAII